MRKIGEYKIEKRLTPKKSNGNPVYKVSKCGQFYAIKIFLQKYRNNAKKEYNILKYLERIEGIVNAVEIFEYNDKICLVEQFIDGTDLRKKRDCQATVIPDLAKIFMEMHKMGVVHRDIKPANIIIRDNRPIVIDFDKALRLSRCKNRRSDIVGTSFYLAPELAANYKRPYMFAEYDWKKADVWSFGVTAFLLIENRLPHKGLSHMFDFSDVLLMITKCINSTDPLILATQSTDTICNTINKALHCNWRLRPDFKELLNV